MLILSAALPFNYPHVDSVPLNLSTLEVGPGKSYLSIQEAIDAANAGDTIIVYPNGADPYYEDVEIDKPLKLLANTTLSKVVIYGFHLY